MKDWTNREDRIEGTWTFLQKLEGNSNSTVRQECLAYPWKARQLFEEGFTNMPASVEVRAIEDTQGARDNLVIIIVPTQGQLGQRPDFRIDKAWRCCWSRWIQMNIDEAAQNQPQA